MNISIQIPFNFAVKFLIEEGSTANQAISLLDYLAKEKGEGGLITSCDLEGWTCHESIEKLFCDICDEGDILVEDIIRLWQTRDVVEAMPLSLMTLSDFNKAKKLYMEEELKKEGTLIKVDGEQGYLFK